MAGRGCGAGLGAGSRAGSNPPLRNQVPGPVREFLQVILPTEVIIPIDSTRPSGVR